jgi:hypothetical protein
MTDEPIGDGRDLLRLAIDAHGGEQRWREVGALDLRYKAGGLGFAIKMQGLRPRPWDARIDAKEPRVAFRSYPGPGRRGLLDGQAVRIETEAGEVLAARDRPADEFRKPRRLVRWDDLDLLYFGAYAIWGYATAPFHLAREGVELAELSAWSEDGEAWRRLRVRYPPELPVHSREQVFHFDERGLLRRNDYTAEAFGRLARAAHYSYDHRTFDGLVFPTRRRVHPRRGNGRPLRAVTIIAIDLESVSAEG